MKRKVVLMAVVAIALLTSGCTRIEPGYTAALTVIAYEQVHPYTVAEELYGIGSYATNLKPGMFVFAGVLAALTMAGSAWWGGRKAAKLNPAAVIFGR